MNVHWTPFQLCVYEGPPGSEVPYRKVYTEGPDNSGW